MKTTIISALCTPLTEKESLHVDGLQAHLEQQWSSGISSVLIAGTMGRLQLLADDTYCELVRRSVEFGRQRGELLVGVGDTSYVRTRRRIQMVDQMDIDGIVVLDPYFINFSQEETLDYYRLLADVSRKPLYLYHLPARTGAQLTFDTVVALSKHPNIRGIKCSIDFSWTRQLLYLIDKEFRVIIAQPMQLDILVRAGLREHLDGLYAVFPELTIGIVQAAEAGDYDLAASRQAMLCEFFQTAMKRYSIMPACAAILNARGIPGNFTSAPMRPLSQEQQERLLEEPTVRRIQQLQAELAS